MPDKPTEPPAPHKATVRSVAAQAHVPVDEALQRLRAAGLIARHATEKLEGAELRKAREVLGMRGWGDRPAPARRLSEAELIVQCLRPLREKGKVGRTHTTPIEHVWGHGIPDHQKDQARALVEHMVTTALLEEKQSQGRRHVWLTREGLVMLATVEGAPPGP